MKEPPFRCSTGLAIGFVADRLGLQIDPHSQDWEYEVAHASELPRYLALFRDVAGDDDVRFVLADMIIQAFDDLDVDLRTDSQWTMFLSALEENIETHGWQIWYWSNWDGDLEDSWRVSPFMRALCEAHFASDA